MTSPRSHRKNQTEKKRRGKLGLFNRADKLAMIGANVLVILEINGKYSIYNSQPDMSWVPSNATLVCWRHNTILSGKDVLTDKRRGIIHFRNSIPRMTSVNAGR